MAALAVLAAVHLASALPARSVAASYDGPWCAQFWGGDSQYTGCSMRSFDMCLNEIRGTGGNTVCSPNPRYHPAEGHPVARRRHRR